MRDRGSKGDGYDHIAVGKVYIRVRPHTGGRPLYASWQSEELKLSKYQTSFVNTEA